MYPDIEYPRPSSGLSTSFFAIEPSYGYSSKIHKQLKHDKSIKSFYYSIVIGKPAALSGTYNSNVTTVRPFGTTIINSSPPRPPRSEGLDKTPTPFKRDVQLQPLDDHSDAGASDAFLQRPASASSTTSAPRKIRPVVLHPALQLYYLQMQQAIRQTSHPKVISAEAFRLASFLTYSPTSSPDLDLTPKGNGRTTAETFTRESNTIKDVATRLIIAGIADTRYVRTLALVAHDTVMELMWTDIHLKQALEVSLIDQATTTFNNSWGSQTNHGILASETGLDHHSGVPLKFQTVRSQVMNTSAFLGSLFAVGLLPFEKLEECVSTLLQTISELINHKDATCGSSPPVACFYLRGLYLLLLHATTGCMAFYPKQIGFLSYLRDILVGYGTGISTDDSAFKVMERRWLIETCNVLDAALHPPASWRATTANVCYRWNPSLQCSSLSGLADSCSVFTPSFIISR
ncbi:hypothetical protein BDN71DRAFT_1499309 [Pleurotus eryngii]|uniref:Uncharacterized protein n=1 Tax=Pleurotus eryngii TaxID=5323 RepID=A0A9P5ZKV5_PLEER|nr:hypothetical protein BDN71DRAFT_1499309 [Pleurotus eryngii]